MRNVTTWIKPFLFWLMVIIVGVLAGLALGAAVAGAINHITHPPIQIITLNEEALFKEQSLKLAKLNLNEKSVEKRLSDFKKSFMDLLKGLPPHYVVLRSNLLMRRDNILDFTETFKFLLFESESEGFKK